jgi:DNA-binding SARP family transcriptional activator
MGSKAAAARSRMTSLVAPIETWLTVEELENLREVSLETLLKIAAERRERQRAQRLYAQLRHSGREPPGGPASAEWRVYRTLLYANSQHRLRLSGLVRRTGLPRAELLAAVRRLREQGYLQFGVERR